MFPKSKVLIIAGSDSSGGAGIQADIKTITSLGSYAMTAITAVTSQNTTGIKSIISINPKEISNQIEFSSQDIKPDAIKIGMLHSDKVIKSVLKSLSNIKVKKIGLCVAGSTNILADKLNINLPVETHLLQACVSEPVKPVLDRVVTFGAGHFYVSQSDKGGLVFGGDIDGYNSYAQRGNLPVVEDVCEGGMAIFPMLGRVRLLRMWGGIMDMSMDGSPIIDKTDISGLYFNGGWCYGGFKATPASGWVYAHLLATKEPHKTARSFRFDRFSKGLMIDEKGMGNQPNLH